MMRLKNKRVTVVGLGKSGFASARFLAAKGALTKATDGSSKHDVLENAGYLKALGVAIETGGHTEAFIEDTELFVTSPGVPKHSLPLVVAAQNNIPVIGEVELAWRFCAGPIIGITGSNGKTTTSHLVHRMLCDGGKTSVLCGNVGYSFIDALAQIRKKTSVVLELSSFQLEDTRDLRPRIAVILNLKPNHLDRHQTFENYKRAKARLYRNQQNSDLLILNYDDVHTRGLAATARASVVFFSKRPISEGVFFDGRWIRFRRGRTEKKLLAADRLLLKGEHNLDNVMAAASAAFLSGVSPASLRKTAESFKTLEHRLEPLGRINGVRFVNDSKSTTPDSTAAAVAATPGPLILVAGGRDKGADFAAPESLFERKIKMVILYGEARDKIARAWKSFDRFKIEPDFKKAVLLAWETAASGDTILLSPMCTSFDQFSSFEHRGETFKRIFEDLKSHLTVPKA